MIAMPLEPLFLPLPNEGIANLKEKVAHAVDVCEDAQLLCRVLSLLVGNGDYCCHDEVATAAMTKGNQICPIRKVPSLEMLKKLKDLPGCMVGIDIGGTLTKMVSVHPATEQFPLASWDDIIAGKLHPELTFDLWISGEPWRLHFNSGPTADLERAFAVDEDPSFTRRHRAVSEEDAGRQAPPPDERLCASNMTGAPLVVASGGGAKKLADVVNRSKSLDIEFHPFREMESLVVGLSFLHRHNPIDEVFLVDNEGLKVPVPWPDPLYPCLVVNMGSGVSILRVSNSPGYNGFVRQCSSAGAGDSFARLGGTACGGATFLGLARSMTSANTFEEALALAAKGDATKLDKQVSDIYGVDGTRSLGLPADITAVNFGKLVEGDTGMATEADIAASLLKMVVQQSVILARTLAHQQAPNSDRRLPIFFVGGFLDGNDVGQRTIAQSLRRLDHVQAHFLRHADFLGALGAFQVCISASGAEVSSDSDTNDPDGLFAWG